MVTLLIKIDKKFQEEFGYRLYIKEGYRSSDLYEMVYKKRVVKFGSNP